MKSIIITILALILTLGFLCWYFLLNKNAEISQTLQLTDQQKIAILSATPSGLAKTISYEEKKKILNEMNEKTKESAAIFSNEEKLRILSKEI